MLSLRDLFNRTTDGVFAVSQEQRIVFWNSACSHLFGLSAEEAVGKSCSEIIGGNTPVGQPFCQKACSVMDLAEGSTCPKAFPLQVRDRAGRDLMLSVTIILVPFRQDSQWARVHLLHRGAAVDALENLCYPAQEHTCRAVDSGNGSSAAHPGISPLSARQRQVLKLMAEGHSAPVISDLLQIRPVTVRNHIQHIQEKLGVHSQMEAVAYAYRHDLILRADTSLAVPACARPLNGHMSRRSQAADRQDS